MVKTTRARTRFELVISHIFAATPQKLRGPICVTCVSSCFHAYMLMGIVNVHKRRIIIPQISKPGTLSTINNFYIPLWEFPKELHDLHIS